MSEDSLLKVGSIPKIDDDERMILNHQVRFWKQKAWRAEQQRDRAILACKEAEAITEKYKSIPKEILDKLLQEAEQEELSIAKKNADVYMNTIGLVNFCKLEKSAELLESRLDKIKFWKNVSDNYTQYIP
ncbi:MAG: hypothetical protein EB127_06455 [Alphaproteobacteria bacterium]|nr:hypothetical protein [Alphaproteobacteria bacterium]